MHINANGRKRNDPCPCGSGLKFKKCCIDKPLNIFPHHTPERRHHWSQKEIAEIPTDKIIEKLQMCGITFSQDEFLNDVQNHYGSMEIAKKWLNQFTITASGFDSDFPWMAAEVLWQRLAPNKISTEQLDDMMQEGYTLIDAMDEVGGCTLWLKVWEELKPRFPKDMLSIRDVDDAGTVFHGSQNLFNWCQDLEQELGNAALDDQAFLEHRIRYCSEFIKLFPKTEDIVQHMGKAIAESLFLSGKVEEGEREFQALINNYTGNPWFYIYWGDLYAGFGFKVMGSEHHNPQKAEELYRKALGIDPSDDETIQERIRDLKVVELLKPLKV